MRKLGLFIFLVSIALIAGAQPYHSPFNPQTVDLPKDNGSYTFLVSGHFYGGGASASSGYPASTLLASTDLINSTKADLFLSTGDMFIDAASDHERYQVSLFNKLDMPLINAVGNHDLDGDDYERLFGKTFFEVRLGPDKLIVLDTERDDSDIVEEQLELIRRTVDETERGELRHVFILSHRPVWAEESERYSHLFRHNTRSLSGNNFYSTVFPMLERIAEKVQVYWFSGSMGGSAPSSIFYVNHQKGIHFIQSAIRDRKQDAILRAEVDGSGVRLQAISLTGKLMPPVSQLGVDFWGQRTRPAGFKWRLVPYYIKSSLRHRAFYIGIAFTLILLFVLRMAYRRLG